MGMDSKPQSVEPLPKARWLDPRAEPSPVIADSVSIPVGELSKRTHELPSRHEQVLIADTGEEARAALRWFGAGERSAELGQDFSFGPNRGRRLWSPTRYLEHCVREIEPCAALDLACGAGRDAVYLASRGFRVTAADHLEDALDLGKALEERLLHESPQVTWLRHDLEQSPPEGKFGLVTCFRFLHRPLLASVAKLLEPGGQLIVETFTTLHRERFGKPRRDEHVLKPGELARLASGLEILEFSEGWHDDRHTARLRAIGTREAG